MFSFSHLLQEIHYYLIRFKRLGSKPGNDIAKSDLPNLESLLKLPVRKPFPKGLNVTNPMPSSSRVGSNSSSGRLHQREYSLEQLSEAVQRVRGEWSLRLLRKDPNVLSYLP